MGWFSDLRTWARSWVTYFNSFETDVDYHGQKNIEKIMRLMLSQYGLLAIMWGYASQQYSQAVYFLAFWVVITAIMTLPPWPMYRSANDAGEYKWQKPRTLIKMKEFKSKDVDRSATEVQMYTKKK